ncbi:TetR/AcrR family transcriptional regulator [Spirochaetia bacterium 38H-sp]|uniref:TetR/AcrR family transcriptional regulator n=1 Tax=Rarispira pelagica TaxID=3141764 RepID=A0ABU9UBI2_9SPIR
MGTRERREREKAERRQFIFERARELFLSKGYTNTSMDEIADVCELSKGTLYLYFKNKEELAVSVVNSVISELRSVLERAVEGAVSGMEALQRVLGAYRAFFRQHVNEFYFSASLELVAGKTGAKNARFDDAYSGVESLLSVLVGVIKQGMRDGSVRSDIDPQKAAFAVASIVKGFLQSMAAGQPDRLLSPQYKKEELIDYSLNLFLDALRPERSTV